MYFSTTSKRIQSFILEAGVLNLAETTGFSFFALVISQKYVACDLPYKEGTEELKDTGNLLILVESMKTLMQKSRPPRHYQLIIVQKILFP